MISYVKTEFVLFDTGLCILHTRYFNTDTEITTPLMVFQELIGYLFMYEFQLLLIPMFVRHVHVDGNIRAVTLHAVHFILK